MKGFKKYMLFIPLLILFINNVSAFVPQFPDSIYYEEIVNIGILDYNNLAKTASIKVYDDYEIYFDNLFLIDDLEELLMSFDSQVSSDSKIEYIFYDNENNILESQDFNLNLKNYENLPDFYLCGFLNCNKEDQIDYYYFWQDEEIYLNSINEFSNFKYDVAIETDEDISSIIYFEENITIPYILKNNLIDSNKTYYKIIIDYYNTNENKFKKEIKFALNSNTKKEYEEYLEDILIIAEADAGEYYPDIIEKNTEYIENSDKENSTDILYTENNIFDINKTLIIIVSSIIIFSILFFVVTKGGKNEN